jgi:hypothetical protein
VFTVQSLLTNNILAGGGQTEGPQPSPTLPILFIFVGFDQRGSLLMRSKTLELEQQI